MHFVMRTSLKKRINITLDPELHQKAKRLAREAHTDFSGLLTQLLTERTRSQAPREPLRFVKDKRTGITVVAHPTGAPILTSEKVKTLLADFP